MTYKLPVNYNKLEWWERKEVREQYAREQEGLCMYCHASLDEGPPKEVTDKKVNKKYFPPNFFMYPVHLQHNHATGMTEGAIHCYCNAVLWEYHGR